MMNFDYFYGEQSESYAFYRTPKVFFTDERFRGLSSDAKILYGILLDRVSLSSKNGWLDEAGRVFVYMTVSSIEEALGCAHQKACGLLQELEEFGLIEKQKQGLCKPTKIYVKNFIQVWNSYSQRYENHTAGSMEIIRPEVWKSASNNTDINNTEINNNNPILSGGGTDMSEAHISKSVPTNWQDSSVSESCRYLNEDVDKSDRESYSRYLYNHLEMDILKERYPYDTEVLDAILNMMLDVICSKRKTIRIAGDDKPVNVVKSQFMKLNAGHIEYVIECMKQNSTKVRNIKQYLLAAIYNAPLTMSSYYQAWVNNDMATGKLYGGNDADN